jgi:hypothetical protein
MPKLSIAILPLCLLLSACAPDERAATTAPPAVAPVAPAPDATTTAAADDHAHHHDASASVVLERPPGGGNWATDAPLRQGMERIHEAMTEMLPAFEKGELSAAAAGALATEVQAQVQFLIANCKLEPAADAQLHLVIGQMLSAADALAKDPSSAEGMPRLHQAVQIYGDHFEHPGLHDHSGEAHHADGEHEHADHAADPADG